MLELGKKSEILHKDLSKVINNSDIDKVFVKGVKSLTTYRNINQKKKRKYFSTRRRCRFYFEKYYS